MCACVLVLCRDVIALTYIAYYNNDGINGKWKRVDLLEFPSFSLSFSPCLSFFHVMEWDGAGDLESLC